MNPAIFHGATCVFFALLVDQVTKFYVLENASLFNAGIEILPIFDLVYVQNSGVSFGMFGGLPWWGLSALSLLICVVLVVMLFRSDNRLEAAALGTIIGGALGNVVDRIRFQAVTDFLSFHIAGLNWPAFNFADVFVVCGVTVLLSYPLWQARRHQA